MVRWISFIFLLFALNIDEQNMSVRKLASDNKKGSCQDLLKAFAPFKEIKIRDVDLKKIEAQAQIVFPGNFDSVIGQKLEFEDIVGLFASILPGEERQLFFQTWTGLINRYHLRLHESEDWQPFQYAEKSASYFGFEFSDRRMEVRWGSQLIRDEEHLFQLVTKFIDVYTHMQYIPMTSYNLYHKSKNFSRELDVLAKLFSQKLILQYFTFSVFEQEISPKWYDPFKWPPLLMLYRDSVVIPLAITGVGALSIPQIGIAPYLIGTMSSASVQTILLGGFWKNGLPDGFFLTEGWKKLYAKKGHPGIYQHIRLHLGITQAVRFANMHIGNSQTIIFILLAASLAPVFMENQDEFHRAQMGQWPESDEDLVKEIRSVEKMSLQDFANQAKKKISPENRANFEEFLDENP